MKDPVIDKSNSNDEYELEIQHETGVAGRLKVYVHNRTLGMTIVRICKFDPKLITIPEDVVPLIQLS